MKLTKLFNKLFKSNNETNNKYESESMCYFSPASDGIHCLGYSDDWVNDSKECKHCSRFIRYKE